MIENTSGSYSFENTEVSVVFYNMSTSGVLSVLNKRKLFYKLGFWFISIFNLTRIHHCGIVFKRGEDSIVLMTCRNHRAKFVDEKRFHARYYNFNRQFNLGTARVSLNQINDYIKSPYSGNLRSLFLWYFITNGLFRIEPLQPKTCSLLISNMLRMCGYNIIDCVTPKKLYKELQKICS